MLTRTEKLSGECQWGHGHDSGAVLALDRRLGRRGTELYLDVCSLIGTTREGRSLQLFFLLLEIDTFNFQPLPLIVHD